MAAEEIKKTQKLSELDQEIMIKVNQERMLRKINEFAIKHQGEDGAGNEADLSDEDFFDMG